MQENDFDSMDNDAAVAAHVGTLAGLIGTASDVPLEMQEENFPILNKITPLSNLNPADEVLLKLVCLNIAFGMGEWDLSQPFLRISGNHRRC